MSMINARRFYPTGIRKFQPVLISLFVALAPPLSAHDLLTVYHDAALADPQLEQAKEALAAVTETQIQAKAALYLPEAHLSANVNGETQDTQLSVDSTGANGRSHFMSGGYSLSITQPLLHYDRMVGVKQSNSRLAQAEANYAAAEIDLLLRVAERYFEALASYENVKLAQLHQDSLARGLKETEQYQSAGFLALTDVQEVKASYDRAIADTSEAEHQLNDALESLQEVTGIQYESLADLNPNIPLVAPEPAIEKVWVNLALAQNLALQISQRSVQIAKEEIERQKAGHLPTLDAVGSHSFSTTGGRFGSADIEDTSVGLALTIPLYQGGQVNSRTREAEHRYRQTLAKLKQDQRAVHRTTSKAFLGVVSSISRVKALEQALHSSEIAADATAEGFSVGRRTALDVIVAEREQFRAQRDYAKARYDYLLNTLRLKQTVGTLSPNDLGYINQWLVNEPASFHADTRK